MRIVVTGRRGLVGSAIQRMSHQSDHEFVFVGSDDYDLTKKKQVKQLLEETQPDYVVHTAAKVGGIGSHLKMSGELFYKNILMNSYMIHYAYKFNVKKLLVFSSVCAMPDNIPILKEDLMHEGKPYDGNFAYGYSKRMTDIMLRAYENQYGIKNFSSLICTNVFGKNDLYDTQHGHVLPSLIYKLWVAKMEGEPLYVWGTGESKREFIYADDLARIVFKLLDLETIPRKILISSSKEYSIKETVEKLCKVANFTGNVVWQTDKPNGQRNRPSDTSLLKSLVGNFEYTEFEVALKESYEWFDKNYKEARLGL